MVCCLLSDMSSGDFYNYVCSWSRKTVLSADSLHCHSSNPHMCTAIQTQATKLIRHYNFTKYGTGGKYGYFSIGLAIALVIFPFCLFCVSVAKTPLISCVLKNKHCSYSSGIQQVNRNQQAVRYVT